MLCDPVADRLESDHHAGPGCAGDLVEE